MTNHSVWYWEISWKVGFSVQKSENCAVHDELGTLLPPCNYRKREGDIAKCHPKVQVYSDPPNKTVTQSKWSAQVVALIYKPVGSCCFRYSLPTILPPAFSSKVPFDSVFLFVAHISNNTWVVSVSRLWNRFRYILSSVLIYLCLVLFTLFSSISYLAFFFFFYKLIHFPLWVFCWFFKNGCLSSIWNISDYQNKTLKHPFTLHQG